MPDAIEIVTIALRELNAEPDRKEQIEIGENTLLTGGLLDSLDLIKVLTSCEEQLANAGHPMNLADDQAIEDDPFRTAGTLAAYIERRLT